MPKISAPITKTHPALAEEWDWDKNEGSPNDISHGSTKKVWWKCHRGHSFQKSPNQRTNMTRREDKTDESYVECPYCSGAWAIPGETSFAALRPDLMEEWDYEANKAKGLDPDRLTLHSSKKATWICKNDSRHIWEATLSNRVSGGRKKKGSGCPYCDGKVFKEGITDLATCYPNIAAEWDYDKNDDTPNHIHCGSHKKVWWLCALGHSYEMKISSRTRQGCGCNVCAGKKVIYETSLAYLFPDIATQWDYEKNDLRPEEVAPKSMKKVWWTCPKHGSYEMAVAARTHNGQGCPYCSSRRVAKQDSLAARRQDLMKEWDRKRNDVDPYTLPIKSHKKIAWVCSACGHRWEATIASRTAGAGCPECSKGHTTSFAEQVLIAVFRYMLGEDQVINRAIVNEYELDVYIPKYNLALEPGSWYFHKIKKEKDQQKRLACNKAGIDLITIYDNYDEKDAPYSDKYFTTPYYFGSTNGRKEIKNIVSEIAGEYCGLSIPESDEFWDNIFQKAIDISHKKLDYGKSVAERAPDIACEWHPTKNGAATPLQVAAVSNTKRWWICPHGHEYLMSPYKRIAEKRNCNICSNKVADKRYNAISVLREDIASLITADSEYQADEITPVNTVHLVELECPHCHNTFQEYPYILHRRKTVACPTCGETIIKREE